MEVEMFLRTLVATDLVSAARVALTVAGLVFALIEGLEQLWMWLAGGKLAGLAKRVLALALCIVLPTGAFILLQYTTGGQFTLNDGFLLLNVIAGAVAYLIAKWIHDKTQEKAEVQARTELFLGGPSGKNS